MNSLYISDCEKSGLIQVAVLVVCRLVNRLKRWLKNLVLRYEWELSGRIAVLEKAFFEEKKENIKDVHFREYPSEKVKKTNSLYVIMGIK